MNTYIKNKKNNIVWKMAGFGGLFGKKKPGRHLNIGARLPPIELSDPEPGSHTLVDPYYLSLSKADLESLRKKYPSFAFVPKTANEFLDWAIRGGSKYTAVRIECPYSGLIGEGDDFPGLCKKLYNVLEPNGALYLLTEYKPDEVGVLHTIDGLSPEEFYRTLKGRELDELTEAEKQNIKSKVKEEKTAVILSALSNAGFEASFSPAGKKDIQRSETAVRRSDRGQRIYLVKAVKRA